MQNVGLWGFITLLTFYFLMKKTLLATNLSSNNDIMNSLPMEMIRMKPAINFYGMVIPNQSSGKRDEILRI